MANTSKKVEEIQDELKVLKNEIKETLIDVREHLLTYSENPFASSTAPPLSAEPPLAAPVPEPVADLPPPQDPPELEPDDEEELDEALDGELDDDADGELDEPKPQKSEPLVTEARSPSPAAPAAAPIAEEPMLNGTATPEANVASRPPGPPPAWAANAARPTATTPGGSDQSSDLLTVAMLSGWMEEHLDRIGTDKLKEIVEIYASMGGMPEGLLEVVVRLLSLDHRPAPAAQVTLKDYLRILAELDSFLFRSRHDRAGAALMSVLLANDNKTRRMNR